MKELLTAKAKNIPGIRYIGLGDDPRRTNWGWVGRVSFDFAPCAVSVSPLGVNEWRVSVTYYRGARAGRTYEHTATGKFATFEGLILEATGRQRLWPAYKIRA